jgi:hypothetical protein
MESNVFFILLSGLIENKTTKVMKKHIGNPKKTSEEGG